MRQRRPLAGWRGALLGQAAKAVGTVVGAAALLLVLLELAPGSPADLVPDPSVGAVLEARWGLDRPIWERLLGWWRRALVGDFGTSFAVRPGAQVLEVLWPALRQTAGLLLLAAPLAASLAQLRRPRTALLLTSALPVFLLGHVVVEGLNALTWSAMQAGWVTRPTWFALPIVDHPVRTGLAALVLAFGSNLVGRLSTDLAAARHTRSTSEFAAVAQVHGTRGPSWRHALLDALPALLAQVPVLLGGTIVVERVFLIQGAGHVLWEAALARDFELAMAIALAAATVVAAASFAAELSRWFLDPRVRELP